MITLLVAILLYLGTAWDALRCARAGPAPGLRWWLRGALVAPLYALESMLLPVLVPDGPEGAGWLPAARYQVGLARARNLTLSVLLLAMWVGALAVIVDFDRPRRGALRVDVRPLVWTLQGFASANLPR